MLKKLKFALFFVVLGLAFIILRLTPAGEYLRGDSVLFFLEEIRGSWWGPLVFILFYAGSCVLALPGSFLTLVGGSVFGVFYGSIYNLAGANLGASAAFAVARYLGRDFVSGLLKSEKMVTFDQQIGRAGFQTIFRLRLIPLVPFNILNFGSGFSAVKYRDYALASLLGMLPGTVIYTFFADALLQGAQGASREAIAKLIFASLLLLAISFLPAIYKKIRKRGSRGKV